VTKGRGPFGFLETKYHIAERVRAAISKQGAGGVVGFTGPALSVVKGVVTAVAGAVTIAFLTLFMLLEGRETVRRGLELLPEPTRPRWDRVLREIYRTIGGYVFGNLVISVIAGGSTIVVLLILGSSYSVALGLVVGILDLIPLAGATLAAVIVTLVVGVELGWIQAAIIAGFFIVYQQLENHFLQPVIYGRTVQLSPLAVLIAVLIGAQLAGILGALAAIPVAGSLQAIFREAIAFRRDAVIETPAGVAVEPPSEP
jgi:predicted PurR-regulated permease PerM